ncbi:MAG TPA: choice-of-anchor B family protein [Rubricoccaceae bacterium]|jgi:choice-of-anchor B domain-containing protein
MSRLLLVLPFLVLAGCATTRTDTPEGGTTANAPALEGPCTDGTATSAAGVAYPCLGIDLAAHLSPQQLGVTPAGEVYGNSVWGWTDPTTRREYAVVGNADGTRFVDVTVPTAPIQLGMLPTATLVSVWREVRVAGDLAVIVSEAERHGLQIFDMKTLRGLTADPARRFTATGTYRGFGSAHAVVVTEGAGAPPIVYAVGSRELLNRSLPTSCAAPGFHAVNLADPANPTFAGCFSDVAKDASPVTAPGYTHDAQCMVYRGTDADYTGHQICFASNEDVVTIYDVTDLANVRIVSQGVYPNDAYTHQGALTSDGRYFLVDDELDEQNGLAATQRTIVMDFQDLDNPELAFIHDSVLPVIDHNQYIVGNRVYQSNYEAGLRVLDVSGVGQGRLTEVAFFDTYPQGQTANFNGQWANYPFFPSGTLLGNDINNGLFILSPSRTAGTH